jgi:hypothetical protein
MLAAGARAGALFRMPPLKHRLSRPSGFATQNLPNSLKLGGTSRDGGLAWRLLLPHFSGPSYTLRD